MQDQRSNSIPDGQRRGIEAAVLAHLLAEDSPWWPAELARRLNIPSDLIAAAEATLIADGLVVTRRGALRASWTAVRGDELAGWGDSIKRRADMQRLGAAIPLS